MRSIAIIAYITVSSTSIEGFVSPYPHVKANCIASRCKLKSSNDWIIDDDANYSADVVDSPSRKTSNASEKRKRKNDKLTEEAISENSYDEADDIRSYFATCIPGLHNTLSSELQSLGATNIECKGNAGVSFTGSPEIGLKSILWCRTAHRIMELVASSEDPEYHADYNYGILSSNNLYDFTRAALHTPSLLGDGSGGLLTLSVSTIYTSKVPKELCHTHYTALTVKNAIVDSVRELRDDGTRPDVDTVDADVPLVVVLRGRRVQSGGGRGRTRDRRNERDYFEEEEELVADVDIYRCLHSGGSLHRRGYRGSSSEEDDGSTPIHRAAMKESLASGLLLEAGWDKLIAAAKSDGLGAVLIDPMTGSATLPTEAALIACDMAPGLSRIASYNGRGRNPYTVPPAVRWKSFSTAEVWNDLLNEAAARAKAGVTWARNNNVSVYCNEMNPRASTLARSSIKNSGVGSIISLHEGDCIDWNLEDKVIPGRTIFVCNPPWGVRLNEDIDASWVSLREFLRREASGTEAWVLSGNKDLTKILRMKTSRKVVVKTAEEDLRWLQYHIFQKKDTPIAEQAAVE